MNIKINRDFLTEYKNIFWKGFTLSELVYIGAGCVCGAAVAGLLHFKFNMEITLAIYAGMPAAFPVIIPGFYRYQGYMPLWELLSEIINTYKCRTLHFSSSEEKYALNRVFCVNRDAGRKTGRDRKLRKKP